jgi:hypothetical protein
VDAVQLLPYPLGFRFLIKLWLARGEAAIDELFETPLISALNDSTRLHDDSLVVFTNPADASPAGVAVAWRLRMSDSFSAKALADSIDGGRGSLFADVVVEQFGQEVLVRTAGDPVVLSAWTNGAECGSAEDLPVPSAASTRCRPCSALGCADGKRTCATARVGRLGDRRAKHVLAHHDRKQRCLYAEM